MEEPTTETTKQPGSEVLKAEQKKQVKKNGDALIEEVEQDNQHIENPQERRKVIPSKPC